MLAFEDILPVHTLQPAADAGGRTGGYVSMKNGLLALLIYYVDQGNAATIALTPQQAKDVSGTSAKAIPAVPIWVSQDAATSPLSYAKQTDAASFTTSAAVKKKIVVFQIDPAKLDWANGFVTIAGQTGASNAANITSALVLMVPRYPQATAVDPLAN